MEFKGDDPDAIEAMLRYLYTLDYVPNASQDARGNQPTWNDHLNVVIIADKYGFVELKYEALTHLKDCVAQMKNADDIHSLMIRHDWDPDMDEELCKAIDKAVDDNFPALFDLAEF